jgi:hypothetical protein
VGHLVLLGGELLYLDAELLYAAPNDGEIKGQLYAAILEIAQIWVSGRNPTIIDFAASSAGAFIGSALAWIRLRATKIK